MAHRRGPSPEEIEAQQFREGQQAFMESLPYQGRMHLIIDEGRSTAFSRLGDIEDADEGYQYGRAGNPYLDGERYYSESRRRSQFSGTETRRGYLPFGMEEGNYFARTQVGTGRFEGEGRARTEIMRDETLEEWKARVGKEYNTRLTAEIERKGKEFDRVHPRYGEAFRYLASVGELPIGRETRANALFGRKAQAATFNPSYDYLNKNYRSQLGRYGRLSGPRGRTVSQEQQRINAANTRYTKTPNSDYLAKRRLRTEAPKYRGAVTVADSLGDVMARRRRAAVATNVTGTLLEGL